jgi:diguanylate cyclase (GGDEF)-like protein
VLHWVTHTVQGLLRPGDHLEVYGNDQLALLLPNTSVSEARALAEDMRRRIAAGECRYGDKVLTTTVSIGIAPWQASRVTPRAMAAAAKVGVFKARALGRNRVETAPDSGSVLTL